MGRNHQVLLADPDVDSRAQLKAMIGTMSAAVVGEASYGIEAARLAAELQPDVVLVRVEEPLAVSLRTLELVQHAAPRATPLVISSTEEIGTVQRVMLAGARGFVALPTTAERLDRTLQSARSQHAEGLRRAASPCPDPSSVAGSVLTVFGPKGGVGKTTLATNLAVAIAQQSAARVAIVDVDAYFGDVAIAMGVEAERTMPDLLAAVGAGHEVDVSSYLHRHRSGVHVLSARHTQVVEAQPDPDAIAAVLRRLAASFDFLIVDTPGTFNPQVAAALDESTAALLVTSADIASVKDAKMSLEALRREGFDEDRLKLVVNHATNATSVSDADLARAVGYEVFWTFPHDRAVPNSTQRGEPLVLSQPRSRLSQEVWSLASHFAGAPVRAQQSSSVFGLFRRRA